MFYGWDAPALLLLPVLWWIAGTRTGRSGLWWCGAALAVDGLLLIEVLGGLGWYLDRDKTWLHVALIVLPAAAVCAWTLPRLVRRAVDPWLAVPPKAAALCAGINLYFAAVPHERIGFGALALPLALLAALIGATVALHLRRARSPRHRLMGVAVGSGTVLVMVVTLGVAAMTSSTVPGFDDRAQAEVRAQAERTAVRTGTVTTEGDELYFEVRGSGPPLLMISGGGGDAGFFTYSASLLANEFEVITYDRRGNSRSTRNVVDFDLAQQARDAVAVLRAAGHRSAAVFGNSGGATIALKMAEILPEAVTMVVAHEPPIMEILPDREKWLTMFHRIAGIGHVAGGEVAMFVFALSQGIPYGAFASIPADFSVRNGANQEFFVEREMLDFVHYQPDVTALKRNGVPIVLAVGATTRATNLYYGEPAGILSERINAPLVVFPGHHMSYFDLTRPWTETLRTTLHAGGRTPGR